MSNENVLAQLVQLIDAYAAAKTTDNATLKNLATVALNNFLSTVTITANDTSDKNSD